MADAFIILTNIRYFKPDIECCNLNVYIYKPDVEILKPDIEYH